MRLRPVVGTRWPGRSQVSGKFAVVCLRVKQQGLCVVSLCRYAGHVPNLRLALNADHPLCDLRVEFLELVSMLLVPVGSSSRAVSLGTLRPVPKTSLDTDRNPFVVGDFLFGSIQVLKGSVWGER